MAGSLSSLESIPLVSILLPAFDAGHTIDACLRSVRRQTLGSWECVVVDDGSGDDTAARVRAAAAMDGRFRLLSFPHRGLVETLNAGLEACRGVFVARMDADDLMHRERLAAQVAVLVADRGLTAVGCGVRVFPRSGMRAGRRDYERWLNAVDSEHRLRCEAFVECPVAHPSLMIHRAALRATGYRDRGWPEDYDLLLRLLGERARIGVVNRRLLCWRDTPGRLSRRSPRYSIESFTACKAEFLAQGILAGGEHYVLWGYGGTGKKLCRALRRHGKRPGLIVEVHPRRLGKVIAGARVVEPAALANVRDMPIVVSVAGERPRGESRGALTAMGFRELTDFVCAA